MTVIDEFEKEFRKFTGAKYAIACSSGTAALHTSLTAVGIERGDKVITTPFTFIATTNAILYNGGIPIFADINPKTYCIDEKEVAKKLEEHPDTKAILIVHLFGNTCNLIPLIWLANDYKIPLIEDCAQALGATYNDVHVGNFGDFGCFSFYASKNLWTFEGGMLITQKRKLARKARMIINQGQSSKYKHEIIGYNYRMPRICALIGLTNLRLHKKAILSELGNYGIENGHYPYVVYNTPAYKKLGIKGNCPIAEKAAEKAKEYFKRRFNENLS